MNLAIASLAAVAAFAIGIVSAKAEEAPVLVGPATTVSAEVTPVAQPETVGLAKRYFDAIGFEGQLGAILTSLTTPETLGARANLTEDERDAIVSSAAEAMDDAMPLMLDEAARITARAFTPDQLREMIAFYETESGKAIAAKTSVLPPMASQLVMSFAPLIRADVVVRACAKVDCNAEPGLKI